MQTIGIGYVRVSTHGQATDGVSLQAQEAKIRAYCEANDYTLEHVFIDAGRSGGRADNRPALQEALNSACQAKAALVVYSLSRLARSTKDTLEISERLDKAGADLVSLSEKIDTTSAAGKMVFRMLAVLSEFERDVISERTKFALAHLRSQGKRISGRLPYGFDLDADGVTLIENGTEQNGIRVIRRLRESGKSLRAIASRLTSKNINSKTGARWSAQAVSDILKRETVSS